MKNKGSITQELFSDWERLHKEISSLESQMEDRIDYIIRSVFKEFGNRLSTWYFPGAEEGEVGSMKYAVDKDYFTVETDCLERYESSKSGYKEMTILLKDGTRWSFEGMYLTRWLFEDFEEELVQGKKKYEEKLEEEAKKKKERALARKQKKVLLAESAKAKLTKEELKALKSL
jgi:hypothetical protein